MSAADGPPPLAGIRVLDFSLLLPGPACTLRLAWLGAEVVKVEPPGGDLARRLYGGALWDLMNRGKRSVVLDLKAADDRARLPELASTADVVVEGFRPGVAERLGFGYDDMRAPRPDVVYCSITGFGADGPDASRPSHDVIFLAEAGALGAPGTWRSRGSGPVRPLVPLGDLAAADAAVQAILAALVRRLGTGQGARIAISALDATLHAVATRAGPLLAAEPLDDPAPHLDPGNDLYEAADGRYVALAAVEPQHWRALCRTLDLSATLGADAESWSWTERRQHGDRVAGALEAACRRVEAKALVARLSAADVPAAVVRTLEEVFGAGGWVAPPLPFGEGGLAPAPELGEGTEALLGQCP